MKICGRFSLSMPVRSRARQRHLDVTGEKVPIATRGPSELEVFEGVVGEFKDGAFIHDFLSA